MDKVFETISGYRKEIIDLQTNLISRPAISPASGGEGEYEKAKYLESVIKDMKFDKTFRIDAPDEKAKERVRPNLFAVYKGKDKTKTIWFLAHMDVVPIIDIKEWKTDPFKAAVDLDKIYGRGAEDNHQGLVAVMLAVKALMDNKIRPSVNIGIVLAADEENGSDYGMRYVVKNHPNIFGKKDSFVIPDYDTPEGTDIDIEEKNILRLRIDTKGKAAHGAYPIKGKNAFVAGSAAVLALKDGLNKKFNKNNKIYNIPFSTFEPTKKDANIPSINAVPAVDTFYMDCRVLPFYTFKQIKAEAQRIVNRVAKAHGVKITVSSLMEIAAAPTRSSSAVAKCMADAVETVLKKPARFVGISGATIAQILRGRGLPCVVMGKADKTLHSPNEYSKISDTIKEAKMLSYVMLNYKGS